MKVFPVFIAGMVALLQATPSASAAGGTQSSLPYRIAATGQTQCYANRQQIPCPQPGQAFYGQDAQTTSSQPSYVLSQDGQAVLDKQTGLTWQRSPERNGDGVLTRDDKLTWA